MGYYPIFLELKGLPCLVIGGGQVAYRKVGALLSCGARVKVVSPDCGSGLKQLIRRRKISGKSHPFRAGDLKGVQLVVAATDDQAVNEQAYRLAKRRGLWINVVDQPALCTFILPSVVRRGKLTLAISTGGISPALAKWIRKDLQARYGPELGRLLNGMSRARVEVKRKVKGLENRKGIFEQALKAYFRVVKEAVR